MRKQTMLLAAVAAVALVLAAVATTGCQRVQLPADQRLIVSGAPAAEQTASVPLGTATALKASLRMGVGQLKLTAGEASSTLALAGTFRYAPAQWKPAVSYSVEGTLGTLVVSQPEKTGLPTIGNSENTWDLQLAGGVPTDLSLKLGVGESDVDLRQVDLRSLAIISGVGKAAVDVSGPRVNDLKARIQAGVGELDLTVPRDVGVSIVGGKDGVGDLKAEGFTESDGVMHNAAWTGSGPKILITLARGVGDVTITQH